MTAAIVTPPGIEWDQLLARARHSAWRTEPAYRVWATRDDVVLFIFTYLDHHLSSPETGGVISFAQHHLDMAACAERWPYGQCRDLVIAPRGGAKSTWAIAAILWALAHEHRGAVAMFGSDDKSIGLHMDAIRRELRENARLLNDFPGLRPGGRNNASLVELRNGAGILARGLDAGALGAKVGTRRPDLIWLDDVEPDEANHSPVEAERRLKIITGKIMLMNDQASTLWTGTVTMYGSILHKVVLGVLGEDRTPQWVLDGRWRPRYYPALQVDDRGREVSYWQTRHPLAYLHSIRHTYDFALWYQGLPPTPGAAANMWREDLFRYLAEPVPLEDRGIWVDTAVSEGSQADRHDFMAVCVAGRPLGRRDVVVIEYARAFKMNAEQLLDLLGELANEYPDIRVARVEKNNGNELWRRVLSPMPPGLELDLYAAHVPKAHRIRMLLRRYQREAVIHAYRLKELERGENGLLRYPAVRHDDLIDVVAAAVDDLLPEG